MLGYKGEMTDAHLRATIRTALVARGFVMGEVEFAAGAAEQQSAGLWLRDQVLPARLQVGPLGAGASFADADPDLWDRLPLMAGLGFRQTEMWLLLSAVKGSRSQPLHRSWKVRPASWAMRSSSDGHT